VEMGSGTEKRMIFAELKRAKRLKRERREKRRIFALLKWLPRRHEGTEEEKKKKIFAVLKRAKRLKRKRRERGGFFALRKIDNTEEWR